MKSPFADVAKASHSTSLALDHAEQTSREREGLQMPMTRPPSGTSARLGLTWLRRAANNDPIATPIANTSMQSVLTSPYADDLRHDRRQQ